MTRIFLTGEPRCGKSTLLMKVIDTLKNKGLKVGGFISPEIRKKDERIGFKIVDIASGKEGVLASINLKNGPSVGKYRIDVEDFEKIAIRSLDYAMKECDVICIDEIGTMELFSQKFKEKLKGVLSFDKPLLCVLHRSFIDQYKKYGDVLYVTTGNRETLQDYIISLLNL